MNRDALHRIHRLAGIKNNIKTNFLIESFNFNNLNDDEKNNLYNIFKKSYEEKIGTSWSKDKFFNRASNWEFFGDKNGFVSVRIQKSGFYKLVGVAGNIKSILLGLDEIKDKPVWGMVSEDIQKLALKKNFKTPSSFLLKILMKLIPKNVFGDADFTINNDGSITLHYSDVGDSKKYFIGNDLYFTKLKKDILPQLKDKLSDLPKIAKKGIESFLKEEQNIINEDITSGSAIVYHRTGKNGSPIKGISSDGYRVGAGSTYGIGVYTTYNLESQLTDYHRKNYGNIIIESKVLSMKNFLIFDYDIAKKIYGNSNYTLDKQLKLILGKEWNEYKDNTKLNDLILKLNNVKYTSDIVKNFYEIFKDNIIPKLRGIVFTGSNDGKVLVSYDRKNIEPIRFTEDEGKTWTNIINKNIYGRIKDYSSEENKEEINNILNKLDLNENLTEEQINIILNNFDFFINNLGSNGIKNLLQYSRTQEKKDQIIDKLLGSKELINKLDSEGIRYLLYYSRTQNRDQIIDKLLGTEGFINKLNLDGILLLHQYSRTPEKKDQIIDKLFGTEELINKLDSRGIRHLLEYSSTPEKRDQIIDKLLETEGFINKLNSNGIRDLLQYSSTPEKNDQVINKLLGTEGFINKFNSYDISSLFNYPRTQNRDQIIDKILGTEGFINNLVSGGISSLLQYSSTQNRDQIIDKLLGTEGFINKLDSGGISSLLQYSSTQKKKDQIIDILLGTEELINKLDSNGIRHLLEYSSTPEKRDQIIDKLLETEGFINKLNSNGIRDLLQYSSTQKKKDQIIDKLLGTEELINKLNSYGIYELCTYSSTQNRDQIIDKLLGSKELINNLNSDGIKYLLQYSSNKEKVKNILIQNGIGKEIINNVIKGYGIKTELIQEKIKIRNRIRSIIKEVLYKK